MAEVNRISRFFVNRSGARRHARIYEWVRANLSLEEGAACLEIGCGNGDMAARIVDGFGPARYVATDLDPHQLEAAKQNLAKRYPGGLPAALEVRVADMLDLPFPNASFDAVFAFVAIHHASPKHRDFANVPRALSEIDRVLKPKGSLVYEEIEHKEKIRRWLAERGYALSVVQRGLKRESVIATRTKLTEEHRPV